MTIALVLHNIRSAHNVGAILRTAEGFGVSHCYFTGYTPYPMSTPDDRLPHIAKKLHDAIAKTALGAETLVPQTHHPDIVRCIDELRTAGYTIVGLEQDDTSIQLDTFSSDRPIALLLGEEVHGLTKELRRKCDVLLEIPMKGRKESFNVSVAAGIALYELSKA